MQVLICHRIFTSTTVNTSTSSSSSWLMSLSSMCLICGREDAHEAAASPPKTIKLCSSAWRRAGLPAPSLVGSFRLHLSGYRSLTLLKATGGRATTPNLVKQYTETWWGVGGTGREGKGEGQRKGNVFLSRLIVYSVGTCSDEMARIELNSFCSSCPTSLKLSHTVPLKLLENLNKSIIAKDSE